MTNIIQPLILVAVIDKFDSICMLSQKARLFPYKKYLYCFLIRKNANFYWTDLLEIVESKS